MTVSKELEKPIKVLFVAGNGLIWIVFCLAIAWDWRKMSASSQWAGVLLAVTYLLLGRSLLKDNDQSSRLMYATCAFLATMITVSRSLF